jgi:flagellar biosynthesis/type III secretory pathway M-ring protein FliF/YscJ
MPDHVLSRSRRRWLIPFALILIAIVLAVALLMVYVRSRGVA